MSETPHSAGPARQSNDSGPRKRQWYKSVTDTTFPINVAIRDFSNFP